MGGLAWTVEKQKPKRTLRAKAGSSLCMPISKKDRGEF
jgi:hypothetical protein